MTSALALLGACADPSVLYLDAAALPAELRWVGVLPIDARGQVRSGSGLLGLDALPHELALDPPEAERALLVGYAADFVRPSPDAATLRAAPLGLAPDPRGPVLPRPRLSRFLRAEGDAFASDGEADPPSLSAAWVSCPSLLPQPGVVVPTCLHCVGTIRQEGCMLRSDLSSCGLDDLELFVGPTGELSSPHLAATRLTGCQFGESADGLGRFDCGFPERGGSCSLALLPPPRTEEVERLTLTEGPPLSASESEGLRPYGYLHGLLDLGQELLVVSTGGRWETWACHHSEDGLLMKSTTPSRAHYVSKATLELTRTATAPPCLRWPVADPARPGGFVASFARGRELFVGRFDEDARPGASVYLEDSWRWHVADAVVLSRDRVALLMDELEETEASRVVFLNLAGEGVEIERTVETTAYGLVSAQRFADDTVAVLANVSDNVRLVSLDGEARPAFFTSACGVANLQAAGLWADPASSFVVAAFSKNGVLLDLERSDGTCRIARPPVPGELHDPFALVAAGADLAVALRHRAEPREAWMGRYGRRSRHFLPTYTRIGEGAVNQLVADGETVYGTITTHGELFRLRPLP